MAQLKRPQAPSRKQKGSRNRSKAKLRVAKIHQKINDIRRDDLHQLSTRLIRENQTITVEDLNVRGMMRTMRWPGRSVIPAGASSFASWSTKASDGRTFVRIDRRFPSSRQCSACGAVAESLPLAVRFWNVRRQAPGTTGTSTQLPIFSPRGSR